MQPALLTPRLQFGECPPGGDPGHPCTWWPAKVLVAHQTAGRGYHGVPGLPPLDRADGQALAYVSHGRWVADCPSCASAQEVDPADPQFWCPMCQLPSWRTLLVPGKRELARIEAALLARPNPENRNWMPPETVEHLEAETSAGGPVHNLIVTPKLVHWIAPGTVMHPDSELFQGGD
jgi:hypothetical protein